MLAPCIDQFLRETRMSQSRFGRLAINDPRFVKDLREGRSPRKRTVKRIEHFMNIYREIRDAR
jgi:hypothetical protein